MKRVKITKYVKLTQLALNVWNKTGMITSNANTVPVACSGSHIIAY